MKLHWNPVLFIGTSFALVACSQPAPESKPEEKTPPTSQEGAPETVPPAGGRYSWAEWTETPEGAPVTVDGVIRGKGDEVGVQYEGEVFFAQSGEGTNFWQPDEAFWNEVTKTGPDRPDVIALVGGAGTTNVIEFDRPVEGLAMAILSLGTHGDPVSYDFDAPFEILSQGDGYWGSGGFLEKKPGDVLHGEEGHGMIRFPGSISRLEFQVISSEEYHGFTLGISRSTVGR